jgi:hypothetical protein
VKVIKISFKVLKYVRSGPELSITVKIKSVLAVLIVVPLELVISPVTVTVYIPATVGYSHETTLCQGLKVIKVVL